MPSLFNTLSMDEKLIALYGDPHAHQLADHLARSLGAKPGTQTYRRHVTSFFCDVEARLHKNRQKAAESTTDARQWALRRDIAFHTTGVDLLLPIAPTELDVRRWRYRSFPSPFEQVEDGTPLTLEQKLELAADAYAELPDRITGLERLFEALAMQRARELGQFPCRATRDLTRFNSRHVISADGTYLSPHTGIEHYFDAHGNLKFKGSRADKTCQKAGPRKQVLTIRDKKHQKTVSGINHVAILTRSPEHGRIILGLERSLGGEMHGALRALDRIIPLADGNIDALTYDKANNGWTTDYLLSQHGVMSVVAPKAEQKTDARITQDANAAAEQILAARAAARTHPTPADAAPRPQFTFTQTTAINAAAAHKVLGRYFDINALVDDVDAGRAAGRSLPLGTSVYLCSQLNLVVVQSVTLPYTTITHELEDQTCAHEVHLDDGALWDTRLERGEAVKDQQLRCTAAATTPNATTGLHHLEASFEFTCTHSGEILVHTIAYAPCGTWWGGIKEKPVRKVLQHLQLLPRCQREWRGIYGLRNDTESFFSDLKNHFLADRRTPSLDPNHQFLDVLYFSIITNANARFRALLAGAL